MYKKSIKKNSFFKKNAIFERKKMAEKIILKMQKGEVPYVKEDKLDTYPF